MKSVKSPLVFLSILLSCLTCFIACSDIAEVSEADKNNAKASWDFGKKAYDHTAKILSFGPRPIESASHKKTQEYIRTELEKHGWVVWKQTFKSKTPYGERTFSNIIARYNVSRNVGQKQTQNPTAVLCAHYDSKLLDGFLGADDAASCVGGLLELAEYFHKHEPKKARLVEFVFFDGEEALKPNIERGKDGLYGSYYYSSFINYDLTRRNKHYSARPKFGILLDMVGHKNLQIKIPSDTPKSLLNSYNKVIKAQKVEKHFGKAATMILDDHVPMNDIANIPTIDIIGDFANSDWWHTKDDDLSLTSKDSLSISLKVALGIFNDQLDKLK
eukprot:Seg17692.1 transcript_id=Seg17692.1/GoldUCD/mRNA.D3Y31 product="Glutaminyl-peptide cyclotransferase" protein_id=Seg17692.1/GoldUCD/D3Y31